MKRDLAVREPLPDKQFDFFDMDDELSYALDPIAHSVGPFKESVRAKAGERLMAMRSVMQPISKAELRMWILPIALGCQNQKAEEDLNVWIDVLYNAMSDIPRGLFTRTKQRWAQRQIKFFPTPADIWEAIKDDWAAITSHEEALRRLAND